MEFRNPGLERLMGLTAADRKWMDEIVRDVNDAWDDADPIKPMMQWVTYYSCQVLKLNMINSFKGSDDYLRAKVVLSYALDSR